MFFCWFIATCYTLLGPALFASAALSLGLTFDVPAKKKICNQAAKFCCQSFAVRAACKTVMLDTGK